MKLLITAALILLGLAAPAEARQRVQRVHPDCNVLWPCDFSAMKPGFGIALAPRHPRARIATRHHVERRTSRRDVATKTAAPDPVKAVVEAGNGVVKASTGAVAYVARHATAAFQCVVDKLEAAGYRIKEMGGFANRGHIPGSLHYRGLALDVNQVARNVTVPRMPSNEIEIASSCGLTSGAVWRYADSGHFELQSAQHYASVRHHRHRYAHRRVHIARRLE